MTALQDKYITVKKFLEEGHQFMVGDQVVYLTGEVINLDVPEGIDKWNEPHPENNTIFVMKLAKRPSGTEQPDNKIHHEEVKPVEKTSGVVLKADPPVNEVEEDYMVLTEDQEWKKISLVFEDSKGMLFDIVTSGQRVYHTKGSCEDMVLTTKEVDAVEVLYNDLSGKMTYEDCVWVFYKAKLAMLS